jgi:predicted GTPase
MASELKPPNIAVIGRTGAGKSTLINAVFGERIAEAGSGLPVSKYFERFPSDPAIDSKVVLFDSKGYEAGEENFITGINSFIQERRHKGVDNEIHLVWYVVPASSKRFISFDADVIRSIQSLRVPICIVISQVDIARTSEVNGIEQAIDHLITDGKFNNVSRVAVAAEPLNEEDQPFGVTDLVDMTIEMLPTLYTEAFIVRQTSSLKAKRDLAMNHIKVAAGGCFATGFIPIPFSTPAAAIASQKHLVQRISEIYEYTDLAKALNQAARVTKISIILYISTSVLDFLSAATLQFGGVFATGTLAGAAAATYIVTVGFTYISIFEKIAKDDINGLSKEEIEKKLREEFQQELNRMSAEIKINKKSDLQDLDSLLNAATLAKAK